MATAPQATVSEEAYLFSIWVEHPVHGRVRWVSSTTKPLGRAVATLKRDAKNGTAARLAKFSENGRYLAQQGGKRHTTKLTGSAADQVRQVTEGLKSSGNYILDQEIKKERQNGAKRRYRITAPNGGFVDKATSSTIRSSFKYLLRYAGQGKGDLAALMAENPGWEPSLKDATRIWEEPEPQEPATKSPSTKPRKRRERADGATIFAISWWHPNHGRIRWFATTELKSINRAVSNLKADARSGRNAGLAVMSDHGRYFDDSPPEILQRFMRGVHLDIMLDHYRTGPKSAHNHTHSFGRRIKARYAIVAPNGEAMTITSERQCDPAARAALSAAKSGANKSLAKFIAGHPSWEPTADDFTAVGFNWQPGDKVTVAGSSEAKETKPQSDA